MQKSNINNKEITLLIFYFKTKMDIKFKILQKQSQKLPALPGVYLFKNSKNQILYIGKAKNLKNRIKNYFQKNLGKTFNVADIKKKILIEQSSIIEYISTKSELTAMLLEAELIKENQPKFNILLKDGQPFLYIVITNPAKNSKKHLKLLPKLKIVRNKKIKGNHFGPFLEKTSVRKVYNFLLKTFKLKLCNKKIENGCLDYHMGICAGSCRLDFDKKSYLQRLELAKLSLKKGHAKFLNYLEKEIENNNNSLNFEKSKELHEYYKAFEKVFQNINENYQFKSLSKTLTTKDIWFLSKDKKSLFLLKEKNTSLNIKRVFSFPFKENNNYFEYITSFYQNFNCSNTILINFDIKKENKNLLEKFLKIFHNKAYPINVIKPKKGHNHNLIKLTQIYIDKHIEKQNNLSKSLKTLLKLKTEPRTIDCFDISHRQGTFMVGSCIRFKDGQPDKANFRHFKIKTVNHSNDYECLQEIVQRRYRDIKNLPDLVLIDGGKGQLSSVKKVLFHSDTEIASLAKKEEIIFSNKIPNGRKLNIQSYAAQVLISLRDYTHHFAISYHRKISKIY